jgi:hypothetical protein
MNSTAWATAQSITAAPASRRHRVTRFPRHAVDLCQTSRYRPPVAANSATGFGHSDRKRRYSAPSLAGAFFVSARSFYGGCAWDAFGRAGFLFPRLTNLRTAAAPSFGHECGSSNQEKGALHMPHNHALNPSEVRHRQAVAMIGAELIAYRVNRNPEQRARLLGLAQMANALGILSSTDRATLAVNLGSVMEVFHA